MNALAKKTLGGLAKFLVAVALLLFLPAGSLQFWEAWLYWVLFSTLSLAITLYFLKRDPALIERRLEAGPGAEREQSQQIIQIVAGVLSCVLLLVPGIERHFHGPIVPPVIVLWADALVVSGFSIIFFVYKANSYAAATVKVEVNQPVISTGPYRFVRHPMYAGAVLLFLATPFALGSWWALPVALALCGVIVVRLLHEERYLAANLPGYVAYRRHVRYRLVPHVW